MRTHDKLFIGGEVGGPGGSDTIDVISPHSEELVGRVPEGTEVDIDGPSPPLVSVRQRRVVAHDSVRAHRDRAAVFCDIFAAPR